MSKIAEIELLDFSGSIGGEHVMASIFCGEERIRDVEYVLDSKAAARFNKKEEVRGRLGRYMVGDKSDRFWSRQEAIDFCEKLIKEKWPHVELILEGLNGACGPQRVVWAKDVKRFEVLKAISDVFEEMYRITYDPFKKFGEPVQKLYECWTAWTEELE